MNRKQWDTLCKEAAADPRRIGVIGFNVPTEDDDDAGRIAAAEYLEPCVEYSRQRRELGYADIVVGKDSELHKQRIVYVEKVNGVYKVGVRI